MANILSVQSSARVEGSHSRALSAKLIDKLSTVGEHTVTHRDLNKHLPLLNEQWLGANWTPAGERSAEQNETLQLSSTLIEEVKAADVLVIGVPIYNFAVPGALKAWIDLIARAGETFQYSEQGPKGLLEGKKAYVVVASGGVPIDSPVDFATPYMRQILNFIGITDITVIGADGLVMNEEAGLKKASDAIAQLPLAA
ncbi:MAG: NAD(P)H-dependent oxidoreductase [Pseudomonadota bacterium]